MYDLCIEIEYCSYKIRSLVEAYWVSLIALLKQKSKTPIRKYLFKTEL